MTVKSHGTRSGFVLFLLLAVSALAASCTHLNDIPVDCRVPGGKADYYDSFDEIRKSPEQSSGIRPRIDYYTVGDSGADKGNSLVVSTYFHDSGFGGYGGFTVYSHESESGKVKPLITCSDGTISQGFWDLGFLHSYRSITFSDSDDDGDYDLRLTGDRDLYERVWLNENNTGWSTESKRIWKKNPVPPLLYALPGAVGIWLMVSFCAFPYLWNTKHSVKRRVLAVFVPPLPVAAYYVLGNISEALEIAAMGILVMSLVYMLYAYPALVIRAAFNAWRRRKAGLEE